jgi:uncharacterized protein (DUF1697 family)
MRKRELAKIDTLEDKLDEELSTITSTTESLEAELAKYKNVDKLHQDGEAQEAQLINQEAILKDRVELLQESAALKERVTVAMGNKLMVRHCTLV